MSQRITIQFPPDRDNDFYSRVFWWAEALYSPIQMEGLGIIHDLDRVRDTLIIDVHKRNDLGTVLAVIKKTLPRHFPAGEGVILRGDPPSG